MNVSRSITSFFCLALAFGFSANAQEQPVGRVILEVSGSIERRNGDGVMRYDLAMLEALGLHQIVTETPWTEGAAPVFPSCSG